MSRLKVLVAEDHEEVRRMIVRLLAPKFEIVGAVANGRDLIKAAMTLSPDVIVSDIHMPLATGPQAMWQLQTMGWDIPFVLISATTVEARIYMEEGATAFVDKMDVGHELIPAVHAASNRQAYFSPKVSSPAYSCIQ